VSEGLALWTREVAFPGSEQQAWLEEHVYPEAGIEPHPEVEKIDAAKDLLWGVQCNAALMLGEGRSEEEVVRYVAVPAAALRGGLCLLLPPRPGSTGTRDARPQPQPLRQAPAREAGLPVRSVGQGRHRAPAPGTGEARIKRPAKKFDLFANSQHFSKEKADRLKC